MTHAEYIELIETLNYHTKLYDEGRPEITDAAWDDMYFRAQQYEKETGIIADNSPTNFISYAVVSSLKKITHNHPMLSLAKTKDLNEVEKWSKGEKLVAMAKMDGLTCSLCYEDGKLISAETRGNGTIGEDVTHNAMVIPSIPKKINTKHRFVIDGEVICKFDDFEQFSGEFKNPRNFASGSIRQLDSKICAQRKLTFVAWDVIEGLEDVDNLSEKLAWLKDNDFVTVPYFTENIYDVDDILTHCTEMKYPIDGIVYKIDNVTSYLARGVNDHDFAGGIAYKTYNQDFETELVDIDWQVGKTGVITPVAVFKPVIIDGATITRASMHNISIMRQLIGDTPHVGQRILVYRSNMVIPQVRRALD